MMRGNFKFISRIWDRLPASLGFLLILLDSLESARLGWIDHWNYAFGRERGQAISDDDHASPGYN
ncbi:hypothetical protein ROE7235_03249 [Roseibaca ekhonensis]|jgi:hypothetical protein|uniref:Uncharacterized protein n=2 Tax=Rhodobacterales TaxID=204455 RepID=A0A1H8IKP4_9RHOB|nr:hypothetical protein SAMN04488077_12419 [Roseovarius tolerans]SUZ33478.1 hypothetical protein ROE7235_03249 [Roseibaca ekhonensis]